MSDDKEFRKRTIENLQKYHTPIQCKDYAAILRSYVPDGDGYNCDFANDLSAAADEIERLRRELNEVRHVTLGWAVADACAHLDRGIDYRTLEVPAIAARAASDLNWHGVVPEPDNG